MVLPQSEPGEDFALGRAIWNNNAKEALREVDAQFEAGRQPVMVLGQIRAAAGRLKPDDAGAECLDAVFRTDLAIKSSARRAALPARAARHRALRPIAGARNPAKAGPHVEA